MGISPLIKVTCAILEYNEKVLVTQRGQAMKQPLLWEFPGGKVEPGETEEACLIREIMEELQVQIEPTTRLTPAVFDYGTFRIELIPFVCRYKGGEIHLSEHVAFAWAALSELKTYNWCPADLPVVEEYLAFRS